MTRLAVIADTHLPRGSRRLSAECREELERADLILHAGDVVAGSVLRELEQLAPVEAVFGNIDEPALREALPERRVVVVEGVRIGLVHLPGARVGREERLVSWFPGCDAVVYGHTHLPQAELHRGVWILNPGSPTERRRAPRRSLLVLEVKSGRLDPQLKPLP
ncbi:MAG TPA: metallophosphoesterase family protein [Gaiellaceae bacterium]